MGLNQRFRGLNQNKHAAAFAAISGTNRDGVVGLFGLQRWMDKLNLHLPREDRGKFRPLLPIVACTILRRPPSVCGICNKPGAAAWTLPGAGGKQS